MFQVLSSSFKWNCQNVAIQHFNANRYICTLVGSLNSRVLVAQKQYKLWTRLNNPGKDFFQSFSIFLKRRSVLRRDWLFLRALVQGQHKNNYLKIEFYSMFVVLFKNIISTFYLIWKSCFKYFQVVSSGIVKMLQSNISMQTAIYAPWLVA